MDRDFEERVAGALAATTRAAGRLAIAIVILATIGCVIFVSMGMGAEGGFVGAMIGGMLAVAGGFFRTMLMED